MVSQSKRHASAKPRAALSLSELLALYDSDFVRTAYQTILGREADIAGLAHFTERLRNGAAKIDILGGIRNSEEGRRVAYDLPWLDRAIKMKRQRSNRWYGWIFRLFGSVEGNDPNSARLRATENNLRRLCDDTQLRLEKVEATLDRLQFLMNRQNDYLAELFMKFGSGRASPPALSPDASSAPVALTIRREPSGLSPRASSFMRAFRAEQKLASQGGEASR